MVKNAIGETTRRARVQTQEHDIDVRDAVLEIMLGTSAYTGDFYFRRLTENVAAFFGLDYVCLCELAMTSEQGYMVVSSESDEFSANADFFAKDAAGETVIERGVVVHPEAAMRHFPADTKLRQIGAEGFVGVALHSSSGDPIGAMFAVNRAPMPEAPFVEAVLQQLAPRISAELERRQKEEALRRSEARLRMLTDRSKDVLFYYQLSPKVEVEYVSPAVQAVLGLPAEAFHANPHLIFELLDTDDRASFQEALQSGSEEPLVARIRTPDGSRRWVEYRDFAVLDEDGRLSGIGGTVRDITRSMEAEEALRRSERYLRSLLEAIPDTLLLLRTDGEVLDYISGEVDIGLGGPEQVIGHNLKELMSPAIVGVLDRAVRGAVRSHRMMRVQFEVPGDSPRYYDVSCFPFGDGTLLLVLRDLTAQKWQEAEEERQHLRDEIDERIQDRTKTNPYGLTYRELAVLSLIVEGMADKQIAEALGISIYTVNKHVGNVLGKMNATSRTEAGVRAVKENLLPREYLR